MNRNISLRYLREEQDLNGNSETRMQQNDQDQEDLARFRVRGTEDRVQVAQEEEDSPAKAHSHQRPVERRQRAPADQRDSDPNHIRVPIKRPALDQVRGGAPEPLQGTPQSNGQNKRVSVDQARGAGEKGEVVLEVIIVVAREPLRDGSRQEEDHHHGRRNPERAVQVGVAFENVEEVATRVYRRDASAEHFIRVDVEELGVVVNRPPRVLGGRSAWRPVTTAGWPSTEERSRILMCFCAALVVLEVCKSKNKITD